MSEQPSYKDVLRKNRRTVLAILMLPVLGMTVAIPLIIIRAPKNLALSVGLIILMICQYLALVMFISRRMDRLISS